MTKFILIFIVLEIFATIIFVIMTKAIGPKTDSWISVMAVCKGMIERLTMIAGLLLSFPQILIAFAALKIGTRLRDDQSSEI